MCSCGERRFCRSKERTDVKFHVRWDILFRTSHSSEHDSIASALLQHKAITVLLFFLCLLSHLLQRSPWNYSKRIQPTQVQLWVQHKWFSLMQSEIILWTCWVFLSLLHFVEGFLAALGRLLCGASVTWSRICFHFCNPIATFPFDPRVLQHQGSGSRGQLMTKLCVWLSLDLATLVAFCGVSSFSWLRLVNSKLAPQLRNPLEAQLHPFSSRFVSGILGLLEHLQALVTQWFCSLLFDGCAGWSFPVWALGAHFTGWMNSQFRVCRLQVWNQC